MDFSSFLASWSFQEFAAVSCLALLSFWLAKYLLQPQLGSQPPVIAGWLPYLGCHFQMLFGTVGFLEKARNKHGDIFSIFWGGKTMTFVYDKDYLRSFYRAPEETLSMTKGFDATGLNVVMDPHDYQSKADLYDPKMLEMSGRIMSVLRKKFIPNLKNFAPLFQPEIDHYLSETFTSESGTVSSQDMYTQLVGRMSCRVVVGADLARNKDLIEAEMSLGKWLGGCYILPDVLWWIVRRKSKQLHATIDSILLPAIKRRRKLQQEDPENWIQKNGFDDLLSAYVEAYPYEDGMTETEKQMADGFCLAAKGFIFAAVVNTTRQTQVTLIRILADPQLKERVVKEIDEVVRESGGSLQPESGKKLKLLNSCFMENTRIGTFPYSVRMVTNKPHEVKGYTMPIGSLMAVSPWWPAYDESNHEDPTTFKGDRYLERSVSKSDYTHLTFGAGRHHCVGLPMAQMENQLCIAGVLKDYDLDVLPGKDGKLMPDIMFGSPLRDAELKYTKRKQPLGC